MDPLLSFERLRLLLPPPPPPQESDSLCNSDFKFHRYLLSLSTLSSPNQRTTLFWQGEERKTSFAFYCLFPAGKTYRKNSSGEGRPISHPPLDPWLTNWEILGQKTSPPSIQDPISKRSWQQMESPPQGWQTTEYGKQGQNKKAPRSPISREEGKSRGRSGKKRHPGKKEGGGHWFSMFWVGFWKKVHWYPDWELHPANAVKIVLGFGGASLFGGIGSSRD